MRDAGSGGGGSLTDIVDAAIEADLQHNGWDPIGDGRLWRKVSGGLTTITLEPGSGAYEVTSTAPADSQWEVDEAIDAMNAIYAKWPGRIEEVFMIWLTIPDPGANDGVIAQLEHSESQLRTSASGPSESASGEFEPPKVANQRLVGDLDNLNDYSAQLHGAYATEFKQTYVANLGPTIQNLGGLVGTLGFACAAQSAVWGAVQEDLDELIKKSATAMKASAPSGGGSSGLVLALKVIGSIAGIVAAVPTFGGSIVASAALVGATAGLATTAVEALPNSSDKQVELGASSPEGVLKKIRSALDAIRDAVRSRDTAIQDLLSITTDNANSPAGKFDLARPRMIGANDGEILEQEQLITVDSNLISHITELWMPAIAGDLGTARAELTVTSAPFRRPDGIGITDGAASQFASLQDRTVELLSNMMRELQDGAEALAQAAKTIGLEDEEINSQLRSQADRVNRGDIDSVPSWYGKVR